MLVVKHFLAQFSPLSTACCSTAGCKTIKSEPTSGFFLCLCVCPLSLPLSLSLSRDLYRSRVLRTFHRGLSISISLASIYLSLFFKKCHTYIPPWITEDHTARNSQVETHSSCLCVYVYVGGGLCECAHCKSKT